MEKKYDQILAEIISNHWAEKSLDTISDIVIIQDKNGRIIRVNRYAKKVLGYSEEELLGKVWIREFIPKSHESEIREIWKHTLESNSKYDEHHENPVVTRDGKERMISWSNVRIFHDGEIVAVLSLGRDVTEVYELSSKLRENEEFLRESQAVARVGSWKLDIQKNKLSWSEEVFNIFKVKKGTIFTYEDFLGLVHKDDRKIVNDAWLKAVNTKGVSTSHYEIVHRLIVNGTTIWVREKATVFFEKEKPVKGIGTVEDITRKKEMETASEEGQRVFRNLVEKSPDIIARYDRECRRTYVNPMYRKVAQISPLKLINTAPVQVSPLPGGSAALLQKLLRRVLKTGVAESEDIPWGKPDGTVSWYNVHAFPELEKGGKVLSVMSVSRDITLYKQTEKALRESEYRFSSFMKYIPAAVFIKDSFGKILFVNDEMDRIFGGKKWIGKDTLDVIPGELGESMMHADRRVFRSNQPITIGEQIVDIKGKKRAFLTTKFPIPVNKKNTLIGGFSLDITDKKILEENLESVAKFPEENPNPIFRVDTDGTILYSNSSGQKILGSWNLVVGKKLNLFWFDYLKKAIRAGKIIEPEIEIKDHIYVFSILNVKGEQYVNFYGKDVTKQKLAEHELQLSEQKFRSYVENSPDGIMVADVKSLEYMDINPALTRITGYSKEDLIGTNVGDITYVEDREIVQSAIRVGLKEGFASVTTRFVRKDKSIGWWIVNGNRLSDDRFIFFAKEITEQKALEDRYKNLFEGIKGGVAIYEPTRDGENFIFKDYNTSAEKLDKTPREKVLGKKVDEVYPGVREMGLFDVFKRVNKTGKAETHPVSMYDDEKLQAWRENYVYKLPTGEIVAVYDDLTKEKQLALELEKKQKSLTALMSNLQGMVYRCKNNANWTMVFVNDGCEILTEFTPEEILYDKVVTYNEIIHPEDREYVSRTVADAIKKAIPYEMEYRIITKSGKTKYVWEKGTLVANSSVDGELEGLIVDITDRRLMEESLKSAKADLEKSNRDLTRLNDFMIGRELKMKELKMEIKRLKEKMGEE